MSADLWRMADDPLGVAFDVMVPCPVCSEAGMRLVHNTKPHCHATGLIPNPAITQECGTCGGRGKGSLSGREQDWLVCGDCEGRGWTFRSSVRVAERVRVRETTPDAPNGVWLVVSARGQVWLRSNDLMDPYVREVTHLWEQPCPECGGHLRRSVDGWPCQTCVLKDPNNILVPPEPGSVWEIGWRAAELLPVLADDDPSEPDQRGPYIVVEPDGHVTVWDAPDYWHNERNEHAITHHFSAPPKPGQRAGVLGDLVLTDKARKVQG